jgi:secreted trypsin-like serine protease
MGIDGKKIFQNTRPYIIFLNFTQGATCVAAPVTGVVVKLGTVESLNGLVTFTSKEIPSKDIKVHPEYTTSGYMKNIALIYIDDMPSDLLNNPNVGIIDLPNDNETSVIYFGQQPTISGYGATASFVNTTDGLLRYGTTIIQQNAVCSVLIEHTITNSSICALTNLGITTCPGDQGAPMVITVSATRKFLIGIANVQVQGCASYPSLYESVIVHREWIEKTSGSSMIQMSFAAVVFMIFKNIL